MRALVSAGSHVVQVPPHQTTITAALDQMPQICVIDADEDRELIQWLLKVLYDKYPHVASLVLSHDQNAKFVFDLIANDSLNNLIARHGGFSAAHELINENELIVTCAKLLKRDIFGFEKYLPTWGIKVFHRAIQSSMDKLAGVRQLEEFLERIDCHQAIIPDICNVADELIMNAMFNAPQDAAGNPKYVTMDRASILELAPNETVDFRYACDGGHVAVSVSDNFGTLSRDVIVKYIRCGFLGEPARASEGTTGAGLGLHMILGSATQLTFNIHQGHRTEVIAMFYVRGGARIFKTVNRSLNMFLLRGPHAIAPSDES